MNEGVGSTTILTIIAVFIAIAAAYMAYNVNYTKAFRMKNKIISTYEKYEGKCESACESEINSYASEIGYKPHNISSDCNSFSDLPSGTVEKAAKGGGTYCIYKIKVEKSPDTASIHEDMKDEYYYRVLTRIDIQIPIVQNVLGLRILSITGDTKAFELD